MKSVKERMEDIILLKEKFIEENKDISDLEKLYRRAEFFLDDIEESWGKIKISFPHQQHPSEVIVFFETLANFFLDFVDLYFTKVNKNHTVKMGAMIRRVSNKVYGLKISDALKARLERTYEYNSWHGH